MAEAKSQQQTSEQRGAMTRRREFLPARDLFTLSPFSMMRRLTEEMDRAFASSFGLSRGSGESAMWAPAIDVREREGNLEIQAELPGLNKDDVKVEVAEDSIIIEGERKREEEREERGWHRSERVYGRFYRQIPLPEGAKTDQAKAEFKDGVLTVRLPISKEEPHRGRQIPINA